MPARDRTVVLVEGASDRVAVLASADALRLPRPEVAAIGGVTNARRAVADRPGIRLLGLCDAGERHWFDAVLDEVVVCTPDLEGEFIRSLGSEQVIAGIVAAGDGERWQLFSGQPAQRDQPVEARLHRFLGTTAGRKERYAGLLAARGIPGPLREIVQRATDSVVG